MIQLVGYQVWKHSGHGPVTQPVVAAGTTAGYGKVDFAAPYLREYLREHAAHLVME